MIEIDPLKRQAALGPFDLGEAVRGEYGSLFQEFKEPAK
ncbi:UNVERIFIED_ORG: hypothetical protein M2312_004739 [Rhizobium esperanzae]|nr:hypothetical protein [Rhizobium esperanzae]